MFCLWVYENFLYVWKIVYRFRKILGYFECRKKDIVWYFFYEVYVESYEI